LPLEGGVEFIILEKNPVQWVGEGGGERGGCTKRNRCWRTGRPDWLCMSYSWMVANKTLPISHALMQWGNVKNDRVLENHVTAKVDLFFGETVLLYVTLL
jgi:hypothetical protein